MTDPRGILDAVSNPDTSETPEVAGVADVPLTALRPHPRNPRKIRPERLEQLKRNLLADAAMLRARPLIALPDGTVIAGNQRLRAATELGWETIPVAYADLDEERATIWAIRDNRGFGEDDVEITGALLSELAAAGADLDLTGYSSSDIDALLAATRPEPPVDPDDAPPLPDGEPSSRLGEVYELGAHRMMCGDATDAAQVALLMDGEEIHTVVTDPPYGIERDGIPNDDPSGLRALFDAALNALPSTDAIYAAFQSPRLVVEWLDAVRAAGHHVERLLWLHRQAAKTYPWRGWVLASDAIVVSSVGAPSWPAPADFCHDTYVKTELEDAALTGLHTTIKPSWVVRDLIAKLPLSVVYDPFAGSGTTVIAAELLRRRCFAMEIDPAYCDVIRRRYATFTDQPHLAP